MAFRDVWSEHDIVFDDGIGQPLSPWTVLGDFRRVVAELGVPRTRFHDLRHAHATQLLSAGVHVKAVSERLGHSSTSFMMDTYSAVIRSMDWTLPTRRINCSGGADGKVTANAPSSLGPGRRLCW
ncbi:MAG TPA: tyrosine-type recombinase/integrase [Rubrobacter sp.]|nr:tyrosine-type recombinase/integrase [Rubrobacter sp.]